jgi:hypothetical protein
VLHRVTGEGILWPCPFKISAKGTLIDRRGIFVICSLVAPDCPKDPCTALLRFPAGHPRVFVRHTLDAGWNVDRSIEVEAEYPGRVVLDGTEFHLTVVEKTSIA